MPFYYYHIPLLTGVRFSMPEFLRQEGPAIPTLAGLKFTHEALDDLQRCLEAEGGRFNCLFGRDEMLLAALALGAGGGVGATYNFAGPLYCRVHNAFNAGNLSEARREQYRAARMIAVIRRYGELAAGKAILRMIGPDPVRLPHTTLNEPEENSLRSRA